MSNSFKYTLIEKRKEQYNHVAIIGKNSTKMLQGDPQVKKQQSPAPDCLVREILCHSTPEAGQSHKNKSTNSSQCANIDVDNSSHRGFNKYSSSSFHPNSSSKSPILSAHHPGGKHNHRRNEADSISITAIRIHLTVHRILLFRRHQSCGPNKTAELIGFALFILQQHPHSPSLSGFKRHIQQRLDVDMDVSPRSVECQERESRLIHRRRVNRSALILADCSCTDHIIRSIGIDVGRQTATES